MRGLWQLDQQELKSLVLLQPWLQAAGWRSGALLGYSNRDELWGEEGRSPGWKEPEPGHIGGPKAPAVTTLSRVEWGFLMQRAEGSSEARP